MTSQNGSVLRVACLMAPGPSWDVLFGMLSLLTLPRIDAWRTGGNALPEDAELGIIDARELDDTGLRAALANAICPVLVLVSSGEGEKAARAVELGALDVLVHEELDRRLLGSVMRHAQHHVRQGTDGRTALALQGSGDGLWDWNVRTGRVYLSARLRVMLGIADAPSSGVLQDWLARVHRDDVEGFRAALEAHARGESMRLEIEHRIVRPDGGVRWILCRGLAVRGPDGTAARLVGSCSDVTRRRREQEQLRQRALCDALTGLPNRAAFQEQLTSSLAGMHAGGQGTFAVLFIDVDRFKLVNDSLGHLVGDELLVEVAARLSRVVRAGDVVARFGGDELVVLLRDVEDSGTAMLAASRIHRALNEPMVLGGQRVFTTASIGIALSEHRYQRAEEMLRDADAAMYQAKALGRGRTVLFHPGVRAEALQKFQVENELWRGMEQREFTLLYQPIVSLRTGQLTGFEALLRWNHPERGVLTPGQFMGDAEEHGLMTRLGEWVLGEALGQLRAWADAGHDGLMMAVNLSASQLQCGGLVELVGDLLARHGIPSSRLALDITEEMVAGETQETVLDALQCLHAQGVQVCLDDFGRGYSSLTRLSELPISVVKLDPAIVALTGVGPQESKMARAVVELAEALGMQVWAEGVERREQLEELMKLDVDGAQGTLFSVAVDGEQARALIREPGWLARWQRAQTMLRSTSSTSLPRLA